MDASLPERLAAFAAAVQSRLPSFAAAVDRLVTRLRENGAGDAAPREGDPMPPFLLPDETNRLTSLERLLEAGPVAVTFHRGHWRPCAAKSRPCADQLGCAAMSALRR